MSVFRVIHFFCSIYSPPNSDWLDKLRACYYKISGFGKSCNTKVVVVESENDRNQELTCLFLLISFSLFRVCVWFLLVFLNYIRCFEFSIKTSDIDLASGYISFSQSGRFVGKSLDLLKRKKVIFEIIVEYLLWWIQSSQKGSGIPKNNTSTKGHTLWSYSKMIFWRKKFSFLIFLTRSRAIWFVAGIECRFFKCIFWNLTNTRLSSNLITGEQFFTAFKW